MPCHTGTLQTRGEGKILSEFFGFISNPYGTDFLRWGFPLFPCHLLFRSLPDSVVPTTPFLSLSLSQIYRFSIFRLGKFYSLDIIMTKGWKVWWILFFFFFRFRFSFSPFNLDYLYKPPWSVKRWICYRGSVMRFMDPPIIHSPRYDIDKQFIINFFSFDIYINRSLSASVTNLYDNVCMYVCVRFRDLWISWS